MLSCCFFVCGVLFLSLYGAFGFGFIYLSGVRLWELWSVVSIFDCGCATLWFFEISSMCSLFIIIV